MKFDIFWKHCELRWRRKINKTIFKFEARSPVIDSKSHVPSGIYFSHLPVHTCTKSISVLRNVIENYFHCHEIEKEKTWWKNLFFLAEEIKISMFFLFSRNLDNRNSMISIDLLNIRIILSMNKRFLSAPIIVCFSFRRYNLNLAYSSTQARNIRTFHWTLDNPQVR